VQRIVSVSLNERRTGVDGRALNRAIDVDGLSASLVAQKRERTGSVATSEGAIGGSANVWLSIWTVLYCGRQRAVEGPTDGRVMLDAEGDGFGCVASAKVTRK